MKTAQKSPGNSFVEGDITVGPSTAGRVVRLNCFRWSSFLKDLVIGLVAKRLSQGERRSPRPQVGVIRSRRPPENHVGQNTVVRSGNVEQGLLKAEVRKKSPASSLEIPCSIFCGPAKMPGGHDSTPRTAEPFQYSASGAGGLAKRNQNPTCRTRFAGGAEWGLSVAGILDHHSGTSVF